MKQRIGNAFLVLYGQRYFSQISVKDVIDQAGVSRASFYAQFDSLDDLLRLIEDKLLMEASRILEGWERVRREDLETDRALPPLVQMSFFLDRYRPAFRVLFGRFARNSFFHHYRELTRKVLASFWGRMGYERVQGQIMAALSTSALIEMILEWLEGGSSISPEAFAQASSALMRDAHRFEQERLAHEAR